MAKSKNKEKKEKKGNGDKHSGLCELNPLPDFIQVYTNNSINNYICAINNILVKESNFYRVFRWAI